MTIIDFEKYKHLDLLKKSCFENIMEDGEKNDNIEIPEKLDLEIL